MLMLLFCPLDSRRGPAVPQLHDRLEFSLTSGNEPAGEALCNASAGGGGIGGGEGDPPEELERSWCWGVASVPVSAPLSLSCLSSVVLSFFSVLSDALSDPFFPLSVFGEKAR